MATKIQKIYCPSCGAPVKFMEDRDDTFCTSCGTQIFKEDTNLALKYAHEEKMKDKELKSDKQIIIWIAGMCVFIFAILVLWALM